MGMKSMKPMKTPNTKKPMTKTGLAQALVDATEIKKKEVTKVLDSLANVAPTQLKAVARFTIPGLCVLKTRRKPATKAGKREMFGQVVMVKAKPAKTVVKAFAVGALKKNF